MNINDYETICPACNGTGESGEMKLYESLFIGIPPPKPNLELPTCTTCHEKGYILTDEGKKFVGFFRRHVLR
jgi:hypothetical protein